MILIRHDDLINDPLRHSVELTIDVAESIGTQHRIIGPRLGLTYVLTLEVDAVSLYPELRDRFDLVLFLRLKQIFDGLELGRFFRYIEQTTLFSVDLLGHLYVPLGI